MRWFARFRNVLRSLFRYRQAETDLEDEFRDHMEQEIESNIRAGMSPEEARFAAHRLVGSIPLTRKNAGTGAVLLSLKAVRAMCVTPYACYSVRPSSRRPRF